MSRRCKDSLLAIAILKRETRNHKNLAYSVATSATSTLKVALIIIVFARTHSMEGKRTEMESQTQSDDGSKVGGSRRTHIVMEVILRLFALVVRKTSFH